MNGLLQEWLTWTGIPGLWKYCKSKAQETLLISNIVLSDTHALLQIILKSNSL